MSEVVDKADTTLKPRSRRSFLLLVTLTILVAIPLGYRASVFKGIPPIDEIVDREVEGRLDIEPDQNAFTYYERAWHQLPPSLNDEAFWDVEQAVADGGWEAVSPAAKDCLHECESLLIDWKRGTEQAVSFYAPLSDLNDGNTTLIRRLVILKSTKCLHDGRTEDAWQWLRALLRFSRHLSNLGSFWCVSDGNMCHEQAADRLTEWASRNDVTTRDVENALLEVRQIYKLTPAISSRLKAQYLVLMKNLSSAESFCEMSQRVGREVPDLFLGINLFLQGEPDLCRLLLRHVYANQLSQCDLPRWDRAVVSGTRPDLFLPKGTETPRLMDPTTLDDFLMRSMVAAILASDLPSESIYRWDREQARQLALELCLCAELFRRRRGKYPESLQDLVPEFADEIPRDLFGARSADRMLMIHREVDAAKEVEEPSPRPGLIIYSRGGDGVDDGGGIGLRGDIGLRIPIPRAKAKRE